MKKKIIYLLLVTIAIGTIAYLQLVGGSNQGNGFNRKITNQNLKLEKVKQFDNDVFFSWKPINEIWIASRFKPLQLTQLNHSLDLVKVKQLKVPELFNSKLYNFNFSQSNAVFYISNEVGQLLKISENSKRLYAIPFVFDNPTAISASSIIVRLFKASTNEKHTELTKIALTDKARIVKTFKVPKLVDGIFCSDGLLQYDRHSNRLFFMYYRRGEFLSLDTNLNLIYRAKTIDTVRRPNLKFMFAINQPKGVKSLDAPNELVNKYFTVYGDCLYILSSLKADNQNLTDFFNNATIDVYAIKNGTYLHSFTLRRYKGLLLRQFHFVNDQFLALYDQYLVEYNVQN